MDYLEIINFRHACKIFDESKKIKDSDFDFILEAGRLSPSSTGLEQWDFVVVQNQKMREKLREKCWNQIQITSCSHLVIILAKISDIKSGSSYLQKMIDRRHDKNPEEKTAREKFYRDFLTASFNDDDELIFQWSHNQCMLAALNMMNAAASLKIDSCPIEGFEREEVGKILEIDPKKHRVAIAVAFGYRLNKQPPKYRRDIKDIVTWIK